MRLSRRLSTVDVAPRSEPDGLATAVGTERQHACRVHHMLQIAFARSDDHLHCFRIYGKESRIPHVGGMGFSDDATTVPLARFRMQARKRFFYEYDFYDH